jgi:beta-phosphoglucomutase-like phosphatase (HAD superfamily)
MWVFDSFSTLVSNALEDKEAKDSKSKAAYSGVISTLFRLNTAMLPIAVCSSATTAGALNESTPSRLFFFKVNESRFQINFTLSLHT